MSQNSLSTYTIILHIQAASNQPSTAFVCMFTVVTATPAAAMSATPATPRRCRRRYSLLSLRFTLEIDNKTRYCITIELTFMEKSFLHFFSYSCKKHNNFLVTTIKYSYL